MSVTRFDQAWQAANRWVAENLADIAEKVVLTRDLAGVIRVAILDDQPADRPEQALLARLDVSLGAFSPGVGNLLLLSSEMAFPELVFASPDLQAAESGRHQILERLITDADWTRLPLEEQAGKRLCLFGIKGGVGRSTAGVAACRYLAQTGRKVLILDLDLESPGVGTTLLPDSLTPAYGVVDWFVEDAVGQADNELLEGMVARSPLAQGLEGEILVAPCSGSSLKHYLAKLARVYLTNNRSGQTEDFGQRLGRFVSSMEAAYKPSLTVLDCRSGLHDISAAAVTRLGAFSLLFALDTSQTWLAYRLLFEAWQTSKARDAVRDRLKVVAALVPETNTQSYLRDFIDHSYLLFQQTLYDEAGPDDLQAYNFDLDNLEAPHSPLRIHWSRALQQFDPIRQPDAVTPQQWENGFGDFVHGLTDLLDLP